MMSGFLGAPCRRSLRASCLVDFAPKAVVRDFLALLKLLLSLLKNGPQRARTPPGELLGISLVLDSQQNGNGLPVARDKDGLLPACLQVVVEAGRDLRGRSGFHNVTSCPPMKSRFRSFTPMATMRT